MKHITSRFTSLCLGILLMSLASANASADAFTDLVTSCENCHGTDGASKESEIPIIGGLSALYIIDSFRAYLDKSWPCKEVKYISGPDKGETSDMCKVGEKLSKEEIKQLADHFASKPFVRATQTFDEGLVEKGKGVHALLCKKCHEDGGSSPDDDAGILAGQWMHYMEEQFEDYAAGKRAMPKKMKVKMDKLSGDDTKALIHYYGSFQGSGGD